MGAVTPSEVFSATVSMAARVIPAASSPNSAQTESVMAGALGVELAGDASYFGVVHKKPVIGDPLRPTEPEDIRRANRLMYLTPFLTLIFALLLRLLAEVIL